MDDLSVALNNSGIEGYLGDALLNHLCYADDIYLITRFIIYSKERKKSSNTHTQHRNKLLIYTITLIYKYIHSRKKKHDINI